VGKVLLFYQYYWCKRIENQYNINRRHIMRRLSIPAIFILTAVIFMAGNTSNTAMAAQKKVKAQTICPVMGDPIDKKYFVDYKGSRIYFCCSSCPDEFKKDPEKYMKKLRESGVTPERTPGGSAAKVKGDKQKQH
jgi:YHS domain-containing protein